MSTSDGKHFIQWTSRMQLDDLDFAGDLFLLSQTQNADVKARIDEARAAYIQLNTSGTESNSQPTSRSGFSIQMSKQFYCMGQKPGELQKSSSRRYKC
ncbi:unnamed protein product [Schistosoma margrebowiei]|uniref:Uncharacterized protein n=1 Tax=Schistosoma margrebowiei TaxID=48269 RepID=A0A183NCQ3_9TREM|nr:unnamed protein product [Schistosoma margrebowiei]